VPEPIVREGQEVVVRHPDAIGCTLHCVLLGHEPILRPSQSARQRAGSQEGLIPDAWR
jgi:hypothetical protein